MPAKLCILQNAAFEGPGVLQEWADARGVPATTYAAFAGAPLPSPSEFTHLALLGSPNSVNEIDSLPWIRNEANLLRTSLDAGKKILGICFGSQLLARALGAEVKPGPRPEVGWHPFTAEGMECKLFQWHGECFTLPPGTTPFGSSPAYPLQGFWWKNQALAIGAHPEITPELVATFIQQGWSEEWLARQKDLNYVHQPERMLADSQALMAQSRAFAFQLFDHWAALP